LSRLERVTSITWLHKATIVAAYALCNNPIRNNVYTMLEMGVRLEEASLIKAVEETGWYPEGLPDDKETRTAMLRHYIGDNLIYSGMNDLTHLLGRDGSWQVFLPDTYAPALKQEGSDFAHQLFTRNIGVNGRVHVPFTRYGTVQNSYLGFRVLPHGDIQVRSSLEQFRQTDGFRTPQQPSLENQWGLDRNRPGTQFLVESVLGRRNAPVMSNLFREWAGMGESNRPISGIKDVVATYSHDAEYEDEAVIQLALPNPKIRASLIRQIKDITSTGY